MKAAPKQANNDSNRSTAEAAQGDWEKQSAQTAAGNSRTAAAQRARISGINDSTRMLAQRRRIEGYSGIAQPLISEAAPPASAIVHQQPIQRLKKPDDEEEETLQPKFASEPPAQLERQATPKPNNTGLPDNLKSGIEALSSLSMDNVKVHYNSSQPAQLNALAYAQGTDIHVAPGQEQHLPHEAWHVVQQAQGRVKPTMQAKGMPINDDHGLEREADVMGGRAVQIHPRMHCTRLNFINTSASVLQGAFKDAERYAADNKIQNINSKGDVVRYINDRKNSKSLRRGLLDAMNVDLKGNERLKWPAEKEAEELEDEDISQQSSEDDYASRPKDDKSKQGKSPIKNKKRKRAEDRKQQLEDSGYNIGNSTPASGYVAKKLPPLIKRYFKPKDDTEKLEQTMRQLTTALLLEYPKGIEIQAMYVPKIASLFIASNKSKINEEILRDINAKKNLAQFISLIAKKNQIANPTKQKKIKKKLQNRTPMRRSSKLRQSLKMPFEKLLIKKRGKLGADLIKLIKKIEQKDVSSFDPKDKKDKFIDDHKAGLQKPKLYVLGQNLKVDGNPKSEEHAEVNFFPIIKELGLQKTDYFIHGPKAPCSTCRQKGLEKNIFPNKGDTGKLFIGQLPLDADEKYRPDFLKAVTTRGLNQGYVPSASFQYQDSESDFEPDPDETESDDDSDSSYKANSADTDKEEPKKKKMKIEKPRMDKDSKSDAGGSKEQALDAKESEKPKLAIKAEDEVEKVILDSVKDAMFRFNYNPGRPVLVVTGESWTCYIRCVLHHLKKIGKYNNVMKNLEAKEIDTSSGVLVGTEQEAKIITVISSVIGQDFYVEVTDARHGYSTISKTQSGTKVPMVLTGAHFSLLQ